MAITILNDRIELSSIFPDTSSINTEFNSSSATGFYADNDASTFTIPSTYIGNTILTDTTNNVIRVIGVNQQTGQRYTASFNNSESTVYGSGWEQGYYRIFVRQYSYPSNGSDTVGKMDDTSFYELSKKPLYWNRSMLSFMTYIQPGTFWMGAPLDELGRVKSDDREKLHKVTITQPYYIGRTTLTNNFWFAVMNGLTPPDYSASPNPGTEKRECVSSSNTRSTCFADGNTPYWLGAVPGNETKDNLPKVITYAKYNARPVAKTNTGRSYSYGGFGLVNNIGYPIHYITGSYLASGQAGNGEPDRSLLMILQTKFEKAGYHWDLPTEAEWEFACRADTKSAFNNGENLKFKTAQETGGSDSTPQPNINEICWYSQHNNTKHAVALLKPNQWGLFDCHGNVYEWVKDWFTVNIWNYKYYSGVDPVLCEGLAPLNNSSVIEGDALQYRTVRGGYYSYAARHCRSANRSRYSPSNAASTYGFRPAFKIET